MSTRSGEAILLFTCSWRLAGLADSLEPLSLSSAGSPGPNPPSIHHNSHTPSLASLSSRTLFTSWRLPMAHVKLLGTGALVPSMYPQSRHHPSPRLDYQ